MTARGEVGVAVEELRIALKQETHAARRYRAALDNVVDAIVILDDQGNLTFANAAAITMLGEDAPRPGSDALRVIHPDDHQRAIIDLVELVGTDGREARFEFRVRAGDAWLWVEATARNRLGDPDIAGIVVSFRDLTAVRALEQLANHDPLTGLANRTQLANRLEAALERHRTGGEVIAVLFIDLDQFKVINDSLGHGVGDELLVAVGERLRAFERAPGAIKTIDTITRFGGDEFVILLSGLSHPSEAEAVAEQVLERLAAPFELARASLHVGASIGIAIANGGHQQPDELLSDADMAMYRAKARRSSWHTFTPELRRLAHARLRLEGDLRSALERDELLVHYQPIIDVRGTTVELEALVRWQHPNLGLLWPAAFLAVADDAGLANAVGEAVLRIVARDLAILEGAGRSDVGIAVNLASRQLRTPGLLDALRGALASPDHVARLTAEITEHSLVGDVTPVLDTVAELRAAGFRVAIDDFGIGTTSLGHLATVPVDVIKLDQSFVGALGSGARQRAVVASVIQLVHALGLPIVGEGVETIQQRRELEVLGCDRLQGFLLGRPAPLDQTLSALGTSNATGPSSSRSVR